MNIFQFAILSVACYRITRLLVIDDGLFHIFEALRTRAGVYDLDDKNQLAQILSCVHCTSLWVSFIVFVFFVYNENMTTWGCLPFAIAGGVSLLYEITGKFNEVGYSHPIAHSDMGKDNRG